MHFLITWILLAVAAAAAGCASTAAVSDAERRVSIDSYTLLGDAAWSRQAYDEALDYYLEAARLSEHPALAQRATTLAYQLEQIGTAREAAQRWHAVAPDDERAEQFLGVIEVRAGRVEQATAHFSALLGEAREPGAALAVIMELLANQPEAQTATLVGARLVEAYPGWVEGHLGLARLALRSGDFERARAHAEEATRIEPERADASLLYARTLLLSGRSEEALALASKLAGTSSDVEVRLQYAELLLSAGHSEEAQQRLQAILDEHPGLPEAVRAIAFLALTEGRLEEAKDHFNSLRMEPRFRDEAFYYLGRIAETEQQFLQATRSYARVTDGNHAVEAQLRTARVMLAELGDQAGALRHLREFGNANPRYRTEMLVAEGQILLQMGHPDEAMQLLTDALAEAPGDERLHQAHIQLYVLLAQDAINASDLPRADALLKEGLNEYPGDISLRYAQALLYQQQGRLRKAVATLEALVRDDPDDPALLNALGYLLTDRFDRHGEARGYIQKALAMEPDNAAIIDSMGWVLFKLGEYEAALDYLARAFRLEADPEIAAHLVDVHWALGREEEALEILRQNLRAHPDNPHLQEVSRRLAR